ncbi:hypothetical protein AGMMS49928_17570 [Spirochaetia bacterium]|nr:hypothetical protein AGMMS49928_17570 [Spirochaetia bacterium]
MTGFFGAGKRFFALFVLFFVLSLRGFASPLVMVSSGVDTLEDLRFIMREAGLSFTSLTPPFSRDEVLLMLENVDEAALSAPAQEARRRIGDALDPRLLYRDGTLGLDAHAKLTLEGRLRSNTDLPWIGDGTAADASMPAAVPAFSLPLSFYFADVLQIYFEPALGVDPFFHENDGRHWTANVPWEAQRFDLNMPFRTFAALGGPWWNFQIGRDKLSFGSGRTGNLAISDTPDYYDFARVSLFSSAFKYSFLAVQLPLDSGGDNFFASGYGPLDDDELKSTTNRYLYLHRLDFRFFKKLSLGLSEGIMVGNSPVELRYLNPLMVFHSFFAWNDYPHWTAKNGYEGDMAGSLFSLDIEWAILPSLALYGQLVMNEFNTSYEQENFPDKLPPNGMGYLGGIEYSRSIGPWSAIFYGEVLYTDPYLYMLSSPFASFISMRRLSDVGSKDSRRFQWIGHPLGRDVLLFALGADLRGGKLRFRGELSAAIHGEHDIHWDWEKSPDAVGQRSPSGKAETRYTALLEAQWQVFSLLRLSASAGGILALDADHELGKQEYGGELTLKAAFIY